MTEPFDPDLRPIARILPRGAGPSALRAGAWLTSHLARLQPEIDRGRRRRHPERVPEVVGVGSASVRLHRPVGTSADPRPALLWIHGGGYVLGTAAQDDGFCRTVASELGAVVAAVDYRTAPAHPFPAALHDCHDALVWLAGRPDVDTDRVAIGGASAGGGLAAALALLARDRGEVDPAFQLLTYPMLDDRTACRDDIDQRGFRVWDNRANRFGWASYLGHDPGLDDVSELAVPARCKELAGLAPAWIGVGTLDLFLDEDLAYAARLEAAGVPCRTSVVEGAFHGFDQVAPCAAVSVAFRATQIDVLAAAFAAGEPGTASAER